MIEISDSKRARLKQCFEYGNQKMALGDHNYATEMFAQCVIGDPSNILYMNSFIMNLRQKYKNPKKKTFGFVRGKVGGGKVKDLETTIKEGVEKLKKDPWDAHTYVTMGLACLAEDIEEAGLAYLKHAILSAPDDVEINRVAAQELSERKMYDDALACWGRISKLKPDDQEAGKMINDLMMEKTVNKISAAPKGAKEEEHKDEGPKLSFEDECEKRLRKNPNDRQAYADLVDHFFQKNNLRKVEDACKRALKVFPEDDHFYSQLLDVQKTRAKEELLRIKQQYEKAPSDALKQKFAQQKAAYEERMLAYLQYRVKKSPNECMPHYELGNFFMGKGEYKEAIKEFQTAKADAAITGHCLLNLAQCFQQIKQYRLALTHYDQAIAKLSQDGEEIKRALYYGARLAYGLEDYKKADDYANQLAAIDFSYKDVGDLLDKIANKMHN